MPLGEFELIARYFAQEPPRGDVALGIGDDAAILDVRADRKLVIAMDTIVEGVHFPSDINPADIGYRALAVNVSDIAAMGAQPSWFTLSLSLPHSDERWLQQFSAGMFELAREYDLPLVGGDTVKGPLVVTVQIGGWVESDRWLMRSGAKPGDLICISGSVGDAAAGLRCLQKRSLAHDAQRSLSRRFLRPVPRVALGRALRSFATAAMDVSDGLLTDLDKLCAASLCGAAIDVDAVPLSHELLATFSSEEAIDFALAGGDDYELLFTIPPAELARAQTLDTKCTAIGVMTGDGGVVCRRNDAPFEPRRRGYDHFK